jgi:hypothetical protein
MKAWYFSGKDCRLRYGDNRKIEAGFLHTVDYKPILCEQGLHGSKRILDALEYAPGPVVWRVELTGDVVVGRDKLVATNREYQWGYDATEVLRQFARKCALDVIHLWDAPDVVVQYLKTGEESLRDAARTAAGAARVVGATRAARAATRVVGATRAARDAAWDAAWAAAGDAAWVTDAAWATASEKQNRRLTSMIAAGRKRKTNLGGATRFKCYK